jgi:hypothetical protein
MAIVMTDANNKAWALRLLGAGRGMVLMFIAYINVAVTKVLTLVTKFYKQRQLSKRLLSQLSALC